MKYQIILSSDIVISDDEFQNMFGPMLARMMDKYNFSFKFEYAQSLEGIKKALWVKKEALKYTINSENDRYDESINKTFNQINQLFKLD